MISDRFRTGVLAVGGTESRTVNVRLPSDWLGSGFLIVRSDARDDVYELDNANNIRSVSIAVGDDRPDLMVSTFEPRLGTRELRPGSTLTFDYEVANRGLGRPTVRIGTIDWYCRVTRSSAMAMTFCWVLIPARAIFKLVNLIHESARML